MQPVILREDELDFVDGSMASSKHQAILDTSLVPFGTNTGGQNMSVHQGSTPYHSSKYTIEWCQSNNIQVLEWSDLGLIENLFSILVRVVWTNGGQVKDDSTLEQAMLEVLEEINGK